MPLIRTIQIEDGTKLGVWKIGEQESFFREKVNIDPAIHHPHKRLQHFAGRYLLKELFPAFPLEQITVGQTRKPVLACSSFHFSISHCGDYAAAIVSNSRAVGIDIETAQDKIEKVSKKFLSPREMDFISPAQSLAHKTVCWSAKEAVFKWYGLGKVDFREDMQLQPFAFANAGFISCDFMKTGEPTHLYLQYIYENDLSLAWVVA
ncbi:4'-phosphopantetheinyl transferase superfamily protein [Chitinophaga skermanii]|uniref:4'-phosphopantetheinyl transferase superfamily protein n=1 Tax=Chitinophaga skermanii TaxID=331697 RepID=A0A327QEK0_9BACT|nr:4'-phosphopantetheinyl transferase superfamily protein [Chitinophaga skermanii]RAJ02298.1 4'-phosphopantetheinyl transferase superfamily protein [Chitinophaga skermanii]